MAEASFCAQTLIQRRSSPVGAVVRADPEAVCGHIGGKGSGSRCQSRGLNVGGQGSGSSCQSRVVSGGQGQWEQLPDGQSTVSSKREQRQ